MATTETLGKTSGNKKKSTTSGEASTATSTSTTKTPTVAVTPTRTTFTTQFSVGESTFAIEMSIAGINGVSLDLLHKLGSAAEQAVQSTAVLAAAQKSTSGNIT